MEGPGIYTGCTETDGTLPALTLLSWYFSQTLSLASSLKLPRLLTLGEYFKGSVYPDRAGPSRDQQPWRANKTKRDWEKAITVTAERGSRGRCRSNETMDGWTNVSICETYIWFSVYDHKFPVWFFFLALANVLLYFDIFFHPPSCHGYSPLSISLPLSLSLSIYEFMMGRRWVYVSMHANLLSF